MNYYELLGFRSAGIISSSLRLTSRTVSLCYFISNIFDLKSTVNTQILIQITENWNRADLILNKIVETILTKNLGKR